MQITEKTYREIAATLKNTLWLDYEVVNSKSLSFVTSLCPSKVSTLYEVISLKNKDNGKCFHITFEYDSNEIWFWRDNLSENCFESIGYTNPFYKSNRMELVSELVFMICKKFN